MEVCYYQAFLSRKQILNRQTRPQQPTAPCCILRSVSKEDFLSLITQYANPQKSYLKKVVGASESFPIFAENFGGYHFNTSQMTLKQHFTSLFAGLAAMAMISTAKASDDHKHEAAHDEHHAEAASHDSNHESGHEEEAFDVSKMIMEHVTDAHEYHLWGSHANATSIYLPIILLEDGLTIFSSSHLYHGEHAHTVDAETGEHVAYYEGVGPAAGYALFHETIYKLEDGKLNVSGGAVSNVAPMDFSITRNVVALFLSFFVVVLLMFASAKFYKQNGATAPKGLAKFVEPIVLFVRDDIAKANIHGEKYKKFLPFLLTIFFFIWISNLLGLIPILSSNLTGNITVTLFLAVCTLILTVLNGNKHYWQHIFATPGVPKPLLLIMVPIEIVGIFTKPFALMVRLFANITAGHIIILALISIIFINKSAAWGALSVPMALFISVLELLVAFLQAYLFAMLSALFIGAAVDEAHH